MTYWRMQLHPDRIDEGNVRTKESLEAGYIGLDFRTPVGDLRLPQDGIQEGQRSYRLIATEMEEGDLILVQVGSRPFALAEVTGDYEFVPNPKPRRVWFRHMREVSNVRYYDDFVKAGEVPEKIPFRRTLVPMRSVDQPAFRLIDRWRNAT